MTRVVPPLARTAACALVACALAAHPLRAQSVVPSGWTADVGGGMMSEPAYDSRSGFALSLVMSHRRSDAAWGPTLTLVASSTASGFSRDGNFRQSRDWGIAAFGAAMTVMTEGRIGLDLGAGGGVLWSRTHNRALLAPFPAGTPMPSDYNYTEKMAGMLVDARLSYRLKASLALVSHATLVQHVFTDDFLGPTGGVYSLGLGLTF